MLNHGVSTGELFLFVGFIYELRHTRLITDFGGLATPMPWFSAFIVFASLSSIGLPFLNGFVGEFLILLGAFKAKWWYGAIAVLGVIFGAAYFLWDYERSMLGPLTAKVSPSMKDLHMREITIAVSLCVMILWIGLYPSPFLKIMNGSIQALVDRLDRSKVALVEPQQRYVPPE